MRLIIGLLVVLSGAQLAGLTLPTNNTITDGSQCVRIGDERSFTYQGGRFINQAGFVLYSLEEDDSNDYGFMTFPNGRSRQVLVLSNNADEKFSLLRLFPGNEWVVLMTKDASLKAIFECFAR